MSKDLAHCLPLTTYCGIDLRAEISLEELRSVPGFNLFEYIGVRQRLADYEMMKAAGDEGGVLLRSLNDATRFVIVSPSLETDGYWRATRFDDRGPIGHTEFYTRRAAILCFNGSGEGGPSYAGAWSHKVEEILVLRGRAKAA